MKIVFVLAFQECGCAIYMLQIPQPWEKPSFEFGEIIPKKKDICKNGFSCPSLHIGTYIYLVLPGAKNT